jgi:hypothetical protein
MYGICGSVLWEHISCLMHRAVWTRATRVYFFSTCAFYHHSGEMKCVKSGGRKSKLTARRLFGPAGTNCREISALLVPRFFINIHAK